MQLFMYFNACSDMGAGLHKGTRLKLWHVHRVRLWGVEEGYVTCVYSSICVQVVIFYIIVAARSKTRSKNQ